MDEYLKSKHGGTQNYRSQGAIYGVSLHREGNTSPNGRIVDEYLKSKLGGTQSYQSQGATHGVGFHGIVDAYLKSELGEVLKIITRKVLLMVLACIKCMHLPTLAFIEQLHLELFKIISHKELLMDLARVKCTRTHLPTLTFMERLHLEALGVGIVMPLVNPLQKR